MQKVWVSICFLFMIIAQVFLSWFIYCFSNFVSFFPVWCCTHLIFYDFLYLFLVWVFCNLPRLKDLLPVAFFLYSNWIWIFAPTRLWSDLVMLLLKEVKYFKVHTCSQQNIVYSISVWIFTRKGCWWWWDPFCLVNRFMFKDSICNK